MSQTFSIMLIYGTLCGVPLLVGVGAFAGLRYLHRRKRQAIAPVRESSPTRMSDASYRSVQAESRVQSAAEEQTGDSDRLEASQSPVAGQLEEQDSKGKRVAISLLVGALLGLQGGAAAFAVAVVLVVLFVGRSGAGAESAYFLLLAGFFLCGLPLALIAGLLTCLVASTFTYRKGLPWFKAQSRRTQWILAGSALLSIVLTAACAIPSLWVFREVATFGRSADTGPYLGDVSKTERDALVALYNSADGPNWVDGGIRINNPRRNQKWLSKAAPCMWRGITCNRDGYVVFLERSSSQLKGVLPPELVNLSRLTHLRLDGNQLEGPVPLYLSRMAALRVLSLGQNQFSGPIPPELGQLPDLKGLALNDNQLTGGIPPELGKLTELDWLYLNGNQLGGTVPRESGNLTNLTLLRIDHNSLRGPLPLELIQLTKLKTFSFQETGLCEPSDAAFQEWLSGIEKLERTGVICP